MKLTTKLLGYLNSVFNKSPDQYLALSIEYSGTSMTWTVADGTLTTSVVDGEGAGLSIDLSGYTMAGLVAYLAAQPGYVTTYLNADYGNTSALALLDATGTYSASDTEGGDLYAFSSALWVYMDATAAELKTAQNAINTLPAQMVTGTAESAWLDLLGTYYNVPRNANETDTSYGPRIVATVIRPAANNVAIEMAIEEWTGQTATVTDVVTRGVTGNVYNSQHEYDGSIKHDAVSTNVYGLFDVDYAYDLINGGSVAQFQAVVTALVNALRAAGTHMRSLSLTGSALTDTFTAPTEADAGQDLALQAAWTDQASAPTDTTPPMALAVAQMSDSLTPPEDGAELVITSNFTHSGLRSYNGLITYRGASSSTEVLTAGETETVAMS